MTVITIRLATAQDEHAVWAVLEPVIRAGETYALPPGMTREDALRYWFARGNEVFVALDDAKVVGTYFMRANQQGPGAHVANCGYMTAADSRGRGVARAMCRQSLDDAAHKGFRAMQFNFVVSANVPAVALWHSMGFKTVGVVPDAFDHPRLGLVDAFVMHRFL